MDEEQAHKIARDGMLYSFAVLALLCACFVAWAVTRHPDGSPEEKPHFGVPKTSTRISGGHTSSAEWEDAEGCRHYADQTICGGHVKPNPPPPPTTTRPAYTPFPVNGTILGFGR